MNFQPLFQMFNSPPGHTHTAPFAGNTRADRNQGFLRLRFQNPPGLIDLVADENENTRKIWKVNESINNECRLSKAENVLQRDLFQALLILILQASSREQTSGGAGGVSVWLQELFVSQVGALSFTEMMFTADISRGPCREEDAPDTPSCTTLWPSLYDVTRNPAWAKAGLCILLRDAGKLLDFGKAVNSLVSRDTQDTQDIPDIPVTQGTQETQDTQSTQDTQDTQSTQDTQDTQDTQSTQDTQDTQDTRDIPDIPVTQGTQDTQDTQSTQGTQDTQDTQGIWNTWDTQDTQSTQDTQDTQDTRDIPVTQGTRDTQDTQGIWNTWDTQDTQTTQDTRNTQDTQDTQSTQDILDTQGTQDTQDTRNTQDTQDTQDTRNTQDTQDTRGTQGTQSTVPTCPVPPLPPRLSPCGTAALFLHAGFNP
ncbi:hypothetical protein DUI87_28497 [Hirundo rustica rustica]|uniref:Uncharacterized protein n=1 Tax=Hirundo rustica rustica TaxID=333673 RepID=A0A3M0J2R8_HIRRU|nr:hypothetical protein DUI87_28497 [Hirundo rustica rustica]